MFAIRFRGAPGASAVLCLSAAFCLPASTEGRAQEGGGSGATLSEIAVEAPPAAGRAAPTSGAIGPASPAAPPIAQRFQLPQTSASATRDQIDATVNLVDAEDSVKYLPGLFVRKRNNGDTQPVLATRTWGVNSSARSLVYADDILLSALIANNNTIGAPRWGLVAPESIDRVDFLYGPYAAAYPGNSIGGVLQITTRMPDHLQATAKQTEAFQSVGLYGTHGTLRTDQTSLTLGDKVESVSWFVAATILNSTSQPLAFVTNGAAPAGTVGTYPAFNKLGQVANVVGAGGILHVTQANVTAKVAVDITSWLRATYTFGFWSNRGQSDVQSYLLTPSGAQTFGGVSGFASNIYAIDEQHIANALSLKTDTHGEFDGEAVISTYSFLHDVQQSPFGALTGTNVTPYGRVARLDGTGWTNADLKGIWRPGGPGGDHEVSFGLHGDQYRLDNPTFASSVWQNLHTQSATQYANGRGTTETGALWIQDAWRFAPGWTFTPGGRLESWRASDGFNLGTTTAASGAVTATSATRQPDLDATRFSPKATLAWAPGEGWGVKASFGESYRFPTVSELYQIVQTGSTFAIPNPNLKPEQDFSGELAIERAWGENRVRVSVFQENTKDALISQTNFLTGQTPYTFVTNVDQIRNRGIEIEGGRQNLFVDGFDLSGSATYVDSRILRDASFASSTGTTARGKRVPYVPDWRATLVGTYRIGHWSLSLAGRYSGKQYSTLDNTDVVPHVYGAFDKFLVFDTRVRYDVTDQATISLGVDNLANEKYFLFHAFPGRTVVADARVKF